MDRLPDEPGLAALRRGLYIGKGETTRPAEVAVLEPSLGEARLRIRIDEGKNRQIRRMLAAVGLSVKALSRVAIGGFELGRLPPGDHRLLTAQETGRLQNRPRQGLKPRLRRRL